MKKNKEIKLVIIGAGSSYTPELIEGLIKRKKILAIKELWLVDIEEGRKKLEIIYNLTSRMFKKAKIDTKIFQTVDRTKALVNADYVIIQLRVGQMQARKKDEEIPLMHGFIGQETNGAGGLFKALRTIPVVLDIVKDVKKLSNNAFIINFSNPSGIVTQAVAKYSSYKRFLGVCNVPINTRIALAKYLKTDYQNITYSVAGLNHFVYFSQIFKNKKDVTAKIFSAFENKKEIKKLYPVNTRDAIWDSNLIKALKALPCGYHQYYYKHGTMLKKYLDNFKKNKKTRAAEVMENEKELFKLYADPKLASKPKLLEKRGGAYYSEVACSVISAIHTDANQEWVVSTINKNHVQNFANGLVVETTAIINASGAHPVKGRKIKIPDAALPLVKLMKQFELLTIEAAVHGDYAKGLAALQLNPLSEDDVVAKTIFDKLLEAHKKYLPQFFKK